MDSPQFVLSQTSSRQQAHSYDEGESVDINQSELSSVAETTSIRLAYPVLSGVFGAQSILFSKAAAELVERSIHGDSQFGSPVLYVSAILAIAAIAGQLHFLTKGLQKYDAMFVIPVFQATFITISVLAGGLVLNEFGSFSVAQAWVFTLGLLILVAGVVLLSSRHMKTSNGVHQLSSSSPESELGKIGVRNDQGDMQARLVV